MRRNLLILVILISQVASANHFGLFFGLKDVHLVVENGARHWTNGTYARNCNEYMNPIGGSRYKFTGPNAVNGLFTIKNTGAAYNVYCQFLSGGSGYDGGGFTYTSQSDYNNGYYFRSFNDGGAGPLSCPDPTTHPTIYQYNESVTCNPTTYTPSQLSCLYNQTYFNSVNVSYYYWGDSAGCAYYGDRCVGVAKTYYQYYRCK